MLAEAEFETEDGPLGTGTGRCLEEKEEIEEEGPLGTGARR